MKQLINRVIRFKYYYLLVVIILGLVPIYWFMGRGDVLINGVDTNFPLDPEVWFLRRLYVWNNVQNGGVDFSSSVAGMVFHLVQLIPYKMGLGLQATQIASLIFWFLAIVISSFILARIIFPKYLIVQFFFSVFYSFNIYLFNSWENVKVANLSLMASIPIGLAILVLFKDGKIGLKQLILYSMLNGIILSGSGINPSYFISFLLLVAIFGAGILISSCERSLVERLRAMAIYLGVVGLVNLFWILPMVDFIFGGVATKGSLASIGFTNWVDSLSENTSALNILRMQGAWDWYATDGMTGLPLYIPYAVNYFGRFPFVVFSFVIPMLVILSLVLREGKKRNSYLYFSFSIMVVLAIFFGIGTHKPLGTLFAYLGEHLPFFSLFRSPWYIFTPMLVIGYAGLMSAMVYGLCERYERKVLVKWSVEAAALVLIVGNFFYSYPLVTGKIFRPGRSDGFYVSFPEYVLRSKELIGGEEGRIIGYPDDEIEQYEWGYRGVELITALFSSRETLYSPLNATGSSIAKLVKGFYLSLRRGRLEAAWSIGRKMGAGSLLVKNDQRSLAPALPERVYGLPKQSVGKWDIYKLPNENLEKIYGVSSFVWGDVPSLTADALGVIGDEMILVDEDDSELKDIPISNAVIQAVNGQNDDLLKYCKKPFELSNYLLDRGMGRVEYLFEVKEAGKYRPVLERYRIEDFGLSAEGDLEVRLDGAELVLKREGADDSFIFYQPIEFVEGAHKIELKLKNDSLLRGGNFETETEFVEDGNGFYEVVREQDNRYLSIINRSERDISANFPVANFDPFVTYLIKFKYRRIYGEKPVVLAGQNNERALLKTDYKRLPDYPEWVTYSFFYQPVETESVMRVALAGPYADDPLGTKVFFDDLEIYKLFLSNLYLFRSGSENFFAVPEVRYEKRNPTRYTGIVKNVTGPHMIVFNENYSSGWHLRIKGIESRHVSADFYKNAWYISKAPAEYEFEIVYRPQILFDIGMVAALVTLLVGAGLIVYDRFQEGRK